MSGGADYPLNDVRAVAEVLADVVVERGLLVATAAGSSPRALDASEVGTHGRHLLVPLLPTCFGCETRAEWSSAVEAASP